jgi:hypothetical protein
MIANHRNDINEAMSWWSKFHVAAELHRDRLVGITFHNDQEIGDIVNELDAKLSRNRLYYVLILFNCQDIVNLVNSCICWVSLPRTSFLRKAISVLMFIFLHDYLMDKLIFQSLPPLTILVTIWTLLIHYELPNWVVLALLSFIATKVPIESDANCTWRFNQVYLVWGLHLMVLGYYRHVPMAWARLRNKVGIQ